MVHSVSEALKRAEGEIVKCTGRAIGEPDMNGPYYPAISLKDGTEICVSPNLGTEDFPLYDVRVERPCIEGFKTLRISAPFLDILYNDGYSDIEVRELKRVIALSLTLIYDTSDRGWHDAGVV